MRAIQNILQEGFYLINIDTTVQTISTMRGFLSYTSILSSVVTAQPKRWWKWKANNRKKNKVNYLDIHKGSTCGIRRHLWKKKLKRGRISTSKFNPPLQVLYSSVQSKSEFLEINMRSNYFGGWAKKGVVGWGEVEREENKVYTALLALLNC